jgi:hypothetical protein
VYEEGNAERGIKKTKTGEGKQSEGLAEYH